MEQLSLRPQSTRTRSGSVQAVDARVLRVTKPSPPDFAVVAVATDFASAHFPALAPTHAQYAQAQVVLPARRTACVPAPPPRPFDDGTRHDMLRMRLSRRRRGPPVDAQRDRRSTQLLWTPPRCRLRLGNSTDRRRVWGTCVNRQADWAEEVRQGSNRLARDGRPRRDRDRESR